MILLSYISQGRAGEVAENCHRPCAAVGAGKGGGEGGGPGRSDQGLCCPAGRAAEAAPAPAPPASGHTPENHLQTGRAN